MPCQSYIYFDSEPSIRDLEANVLSSYKKSFVEMIQKTSEVKIDSFATIGFKAGNRFMLHLQAKEAADIQALVQKLLHTELGTHLKIVQTFIGLKHASQYAPPHLAEKENPETPSRKYFIVYPFTKTHAWHQLSFDDRKAMMKEHVGIGRTFADAIDQTLLYGFGVDDHEFILSYETDDLFAFQKLVMDLRNTKGRPFTEYDTPLFLATRCSLAEALETI